MFDFGFSELLVIGTVLLMVLGPDKLLVLSRSTGRLLGRVWGWQAGFKDRLAAEMQVAELSALKTRLHESVSEIQQQALPAWERLPPQRTPADFGLTTAALPAAVVPQYSLPRVSLRRQAMTRRRDVRPRYRPLPALRVRRRLPLSSTAG